MDENSLTQYIQNTGGGSSFHNPQLRPDYGFNGMPFSGTQLGQLAMPFAQPFVSGMMGRSNQSPYGISDQNLYNRMKAQAATAAMDDTVRAAAQLERANWERSMQGMHRMATYNPATGQSAAWTTQTAQAAQTLSGAMVSMAPVMAQMAPDVLREMGGTRGSATLMAMRLAEAGRHQIDPVTGQRGNSVMSNLAGMKRIQDTLFAGPDWQRNTMGFSQDQVGDSIAELSSRGLIDTGGSRDDRIRKAVLGMKHYGNEEQQANVAKAMSAAGIDPSRRIGELNPTEMAKIGSDPNVQYQMRTDNADRATQAFKKYSKALSAVQDIFGDAGKKGSAGELFAMLDSISGNAAHMVDPDTLAVKVRQFHQLAKSTVGLKGALEISNTAANIVNQVSQQNPAVNATAILETTNAGQAAFSAYQQAGLGATSAWGGYSQEQYMQAQMIRAAKGRGSFVANQLGAVARVGETVGFEKGSAGEAMMDAIKRGEGTYTDPATGKTVDINNLQNNQLAEIVSSSTGGAMSAAGFTQLLRQKNANQRLVNKHGIGGIAMRGQIEEQFKRAQNDTRFASEAVLGKALGKDTAADLADETVKILRERTENADPSAMNDENRTDTMVTAMLNNKKFIAARKQLMAQGMTMEQANKMLAAQAENVYGALDNRMADGKYREITSARQLLQAGSGKAQRAEDDMRAVAMQEGVAAEQMAAIGKGTAVQRMVDALQEGKSMEEAISSGLGGIKDSDVREQVESYMKQVKVQEDAMTEEEKKIISMPEGTPEEIEAKRVAISGKPRLRARAAAMMKVTQTLQNAANKDIADRGTKTWQDSKDSNRLYTFKFDDEGNMVSATTGGRDGGEKALTKEEAIKAYQARKAERDERAAQEVQKAAGTNTEQVETAGGKDNASGGGSSTSTGGGKLIIEGTLTMNNDGTYSIKGRGGAPTGAK